MLLVCAALGGATGTAEAVNPTIDQKTACATEFDVIRVSFAPNTVVVRADMLPGPFRGTITAFGHNTKWTGTLDRWNASTAQGMDWSSVVVKADAPIEGIEYAPTFASCTFYAGARNSNGYDSNWLIDGPIVDVGNPQSIDPPTCARPYVPASVVRAVEPTTPGQAYVTGDVRVAVTLDDTGQPLHGRVVSSPAAVLDAPSFDAAVHSTYRPTIFRCKPVPSGYEFAVEFAGF